MKKILIKLASWYLRKQGIIYMTKDSFKIPITIKVKNKIINLKGLLDSGNSLFEPISRYPVIIIESKMINNILNDDIYDKIIPYNGINTTGIIKGFQPEEINIKNRKIKKVIIGVSDSKLSPNGSYNAILHPNLLFI